MIVIDVLFSMFLHFKGNVDYSNYEVRNVRRLKRKHMSRICKMSHVDEERN